MMIRKYDATMTIVYQCNIKAFFYQERGVGKKQKDGTNGPLKNGNMENMERWTKNGKWAHGCCSCSLLLYLIPPSVLLSETFALLMSTRTAASVLGTSAGNMLSRPDWAQLGLRHHAIHLGTCSGQSRLAGASWRWNAPPHEALAVFCPHRFQL